uniref:Fibrinogen C-terminal domain-containing protein n=1 Tax=Macrostomum lignano TaxID=282301 RepID=A0A1I8IWU4_9PLAT
MQLQTALHLTIWLCLGIGVSAKIKVNFLNQPADIIYNYLSGTFEVTMMAKIGEYVRGEPQSHLKVERLAVKLDSGRDFGVPVTARLSTDGTVAQLVFECRSWRKCLQVREQINLNPAKVQRAIEFTLTGHSDTGFFNLHVRAPESAPAQYAVEFQRNFDRIISFAQNWDTYVKGFGNSDIRLGNYWMVRRHSSERNLQDFQVRGEDENFKLRVGDAEPGNPMYMMKNHDNAQFSTFDRDNDKWSADCSGYHGKTGWWYHD